MSSLQVKDDNDGFKQHQERLKRESEGVSNFIWRYGEKIYQCFNGNWGIGLRDFDQSVVYFYFSENGQIKRVKSTHFEKVPTSFPQKALVPSFSKFPFFEACDCVRSESPMKYLDELCTGFFGELRFLTHTDVIVAYPTRGFVEEKQFSEGFDLAIFAGERSNNCMLFYRFESPCEIYKHDWI
jgi:hypothetical protein